MKIQFERYFDKYKKELIEMIKSLYEEDPEGEFITIYKINSTIKELSNHPNKGEILLIFLNNVLIGYSIIIFYWSNEYGGDLVNIDELYIKKEYRNNGYGRKFIEYIKNRYKDIAKGFMIEVTPSNNRVHNYYKSLGFNEILNRHMIFKIRGNHEKKNFI